MSARRGKRSSADSHASDSDRRAGGVSPLVRRAPWAIAGIAALVRLVYFFEYALSPLSGFYGADDVYYLTWAGRIAAGDWLGSEVFEQGPLYPYLLGLLFALIGPRIGVVLVLQLLSGMVVALLVYDCGRRLFDRTTGIAAGLMAAVYGPAVFYECTLMKSFLSPLLTIVAMNAALRYGESRRVRWLAVAGIAVGLACLIQEHHILLLIPLIASLAASLATRWGSVGVSASQATRLTGVAHTAVLLVCTFLCILPCTVRNRIVAGEWVLVTTGGGEAFYMAQGPQARGFYYPPDFVLAATSQEHEDFRTEARRRTGREMSRSESSRYWFGEGLKSALADPLRAIRLMMEKAAILLGDYDVPDSQSYVATRHFVPALWILPSFGWIGGLGLVGVALCLPAWRRYVLPLGFVAAHVLPILIFYNFGRLRIGMMPVWILLAAFAGVWIVRRWQPPQRQRAVVALLVAVALSAAMFYPLLAEDFRLSDAKFIASLALRGQDLELAEEQLREIITVLERLPVEESQSVQYIAQVADLRRMLAEVYLRGGKWREGIEQIRALRRLPSREDHRVSLLKSCAALLEAALKDPRLPADSPEAAFVREELNAIR